MVENILSALIDIAIEITSKTAHNFKPYGITYFIYGY